MSLLKDAAVCPFCGNDVIKSDLIDGEIRAWCTNCLAVGPTRHFGPDGTAAGAWGDRVESTDVDALRARAEAAEQRAEAAEAALAQARADRALLAGLWLATAPMDVLIEMLPADLDSRGRLTAALDAVDLQPGVEARIAAGRAVVARIVADAEGGAR